MKESIIISGMLQVLTCILLMVQPRQSIPLGFKPVLYPGELIQGSHHARENHYRFERRLIIGQDHPYNRYSSARIFWPEERAPRPERGRITFFRCVNRTPSTARAVMHVIQGGMGSPEVVVDVRYAPVRFTLINVMIITCHICTEGSDFVAEKEPLLWNSFHDQIKQITDQADLISTFNTTARNPTVSSSETAGFEETTSPVHIETTTQRIITFPSSDTAGFYNEELREETDETSVNLERTTPKTDYGIVSDQEKSEERDEGVLWINGSLRKGGKNLQGNGTRKYEYAERAHLSAGNMTSEIAEKSLHTTVKCPSRGKITLRVEDEASGKEEIIEILCGWRLRSPEGIGFSKIETSSTISSEYLNDDDDLMSVISSSSAAIAPSTKLTTLEATSSETVKTASGLRMNVASAGTTIQSSQTKEASDIECGNISLRPSAPRYDRIWKSVMTSIEDLQDKNSSTERPIKKVTTPLTYNLLLRIVPLGSKKKIGLAKISY